jgi:Fic family protein
MRYFHDHPDWPHFRWDMGKLAQPMADVRYQQGHLLGKMEGLGFNPKQETLLRNLSEDVLKTSAIAGERLDGELVRSSIARRLGIDIGALKPADRHVDGIVELQLDATRNYAQPLTVERLFRWHAGLFPTGGRWRISGMQVASKAGVHFEAPAAARLDDEMRRFIEWFNAPDSTAGVLRASLAHLWFVTVHPFDDGNGRIARALADMQLGRTEGSPQRYYSMSGQIQAERERYYSMLEQTQAGDLDITLWMQWFLDCLGRSIARAEEDLAGEMAKNRFWEAVGTHTLNDRQRTMLQRLLDGFEGKLTNAKWAQLTKCSPDTALRDMQSLVERGILTRGAEGGRSTSYELEPGA